MAPASKYASALRASVLFAYAAFMSHEASAQTITITQTCETASLNSTALTKIPFAQEDFVAISETLARFSLLEGELIDDLLQKSVIDPEIYDEQHEMIMEYRDELEKHLSGQYADAGSFEDYNDNILMNFALKLEDYLTVLDSLYEDNPDINAAFASIEANRQRLKNAAAQRMQNKTGIASCEQPVLPTPGQENYGEHAPALALS